MSCGKSFKAYRRFLWRLWLAASLYFQLPLSGSAMRSMLRLLFPMAAAISSLDAGRLISFIRLHRIRAEV